MKIKLAIKNLLQKLYSYAFPTEHDKIVSKWYRDGGDDKFRYDYDLCSESIVFDLGGYKGQWASDIYARYNCSVFIFEPVKSFADKIAERFKNNKNINVFSLALGKNSRQDLIALHENGSSIYKESETKENMEFEDVASFFIQHDITSVDLMKINIEGGEYELLDRLIETKLINKIKYLQIQFHNYAPNHEMLMNGLCEELMKTHNRTYSYKFVWDNWVLKA